LALSILKPRDLIRVHDEKADSWRIVCMEKGPKKQLEIMHDALARYGLSQNEIRAYVYLAEADEKKLQKLLKPYRFTEPKPTEHFETWKKEA